MLSKDDRQIIRPEGRNVNQGLCKFSDWCALGDAERLWQMNGWGDTLQSLHPTVAEESKDILYAYRLFTSCLVKLNDV